MAHWLLQQTSFFTGRSGAVDKGSNRRGLRFRIARLKSLAQRSIYRRLGTTGFLMARRMVVLSRYFLNRTYDPDYALAKALPRDALILDIGANAGQSALAFARLSPKARIISFEPNPANRPDLGLVARLLGQRFSWHGVALSSGEGTARLHTPVLGRTPVPGEATLTASALGQAQKRLGVFSDMNIVEVPTRTLDSFDLAPDLIKLDVQGHEADVLRGMAETLRRHAPLLLIEYGDNFSALAEILGAMGYEVPASASGAAPTGCRNFTARPSGAALKRQADQSAPSFESVAAA